MGIRKGPKVRSLSVKAKNYEEYSSSLVSCSSLHVSAQVEPILQCSFSQKSKDPWDHVQCRAVYFTHRVKHSTPCDTRDTSTSRRRCIAPQSKPSAATNQYSWTQLPTTILGGRNRVQSSCQKQNKKHGRQLATDSAT